MASEAARRSTKAEPRAGDYPAAVTNATAITTALRPPGPFWMFNREERNAVAILFGLLTQRRNLDAFGSLFDWHPPDLADAEIAVEWSYLRDLWWHHSRTWTDPDDGRRAILDALHPPNRAELAALSVVDFNRFFGAVPKPSEKYIQAPSNWSIGRFAPNIDDDQVFLAACRFKWAFNGKPELVIQTPSGEALCVEAKMDSGEGSYPSTPSEKAIFNNRGLDRVSQTSVQRYLVDDLLGLNGTHVFISRKRRSVPGYSSTTWTELARSLDFGEAPDFVRQWANQFT